MLPSIRSINFSDFKLHNNHFCMSDELDSWLIMAETPRIPSSLTGVVWDGSGLLRPLPWWQCLCAFLLACCPLGTSQPLLLSGTSGTKQRFNDSMMNLHLGRNNRAPLQAGCWLALQREPIGSWWTRSWKRASNSPLSKAGSRDPSYVYKYLIEVSTDRGRIFSVVPSDTTRGDRHKLKHSKRKNFFYWQGN